MPRYYTQLEDDQNVPQRRYTMGGHCVMCHKVYIKNKKEDTMCDECKVLVQVESSPCCKIC